MPARPFKQLSYEATDGGRWSFVGSSVPVMNESNISFLFCLCFPARIVSFYFSSGYKSCFEVYKSGQNISGVYKIDPDGLGDFEVYCDHKTAGGGWTVFQKRQNGSVDFYLTWDDYKRGFGDLKGEFWLGLDKIHRLTVSDNNKLRVDLEDNLGNTAFAEYSTFSVARERAKYQLSLGTYSGAFEIFIDSSIVLSIEILSYDKVMKESNRISLHSFKRN